ncbi:hypothetical protein IZU99_08495 [Oscillospiraceae bacterium CM]|nr:hypothetical protein IZU99_08495 [Oscillospiraceae bacterium CM]
MYVYCCQYAHATVFNTIYGVDISENDFGKNIWSTAPSREGMIDVIRILLGVSYNYIEAFYKEDDFSALFVLCLFNDIATSLKSCKKKEKK